MTKSDGDAATMAALHKRTCPLCEGMCGLAVAEDAEGRISIRPDPDNVWSRGHICPKGTTLGELHRDPDRITTPMIRDGLAWRSATWDEAFDHIADRLKRMRHDHPDALVASYTGNMSGKGFATGRYMMLLHGLARFDASFSSSSVDQLPKNVSSHLLYGDMWRIPVPDIDRTDLFVILGGNPAASKGSLFAHRDVMGAIRALRARGGKVIVVDPVRTRTAQAADQWIGIRPGGDAALLLGVLHFLLASGICNPGPLGQWVDGLNEIAAIAHRFPPERVSAFCGVDVSTIRDLADAIARAPTAAVYGRIGTCTQNYGTLTSWLIDVISIVTGNLDRPGGMMWSTQVAPHLDLTPPYPSTAEIMGALSRVRGFPSVLGQYPASCLAEEIDTPGPGQVRALLTMAGNPVLSVPGSSRLDEALPQLDCMVSLDIYINETTRHAHVILPSPSLLEQPHWDIWAWPWSATSGGHYSPVLTDPIDRPEEWQVMIRLGALFGGMDDPDVDALDDEYFGGMCDAVGIDRSVAMTALPDHGPERILDLCIRSGPFGDRFGAVPDGLTLDHFKAKPEGILLGPAVSLGATAIRTASGRIDLTHPHFLTDLERLENDLAVPSDDLLLVSRRQLRSLNSWMHNVTTLVKGKDRCTLQMHPVDAEKRGLAMGDAVIVHSSNGAVTAPLEITLDIRPGVVCLPHGWGHDRPGARLRVAEERPGSNINQLSPPSLLDPASGTAVLNGVRVEVTAA
ncbi:molybdopterin-dependent oxidoreductase [Novosphingobium sp. BL-52-GroH]|uniref:molybdopterin-dependent oxidoreductase n=1 Tax=Novosphingobium sp. BL-52-GroH TaxID=3349877 RepID=UPI0038507B91